MSDYRTDGPPQHQGGERYRLTIRALPSGYSPIGRLKRVLKGLLRTYDFGAEQVEDVTAYPVGKPADAPSPLQEDETWP